jgi:signal transduction histidine kinase/ligand-binding sensor domain-containing protein/DNA-binding response OmpR family regulator
MKLKVLLLILLCWTPFGRQYAQSNDYAFSHLDVAGGLSNNHITCIYKDARGYMWFGTASGLDRWDGYQFKVYKHDARDTNSLSDNYIEQMFQGPDGKLWIESRAGRFNIYDLTTDKFSRNYLDYLRSLSLPDSWLLKILIWKGDYWFIYKDKGIYHRQQDGRIIPFQAIDGDIHSISPAPICSAQVDVDGNCWVVHEDGRMEKIDSRLNKVVLNTAILQQTVNPPLSICHIFIDKENDCWFSGSGVFKGTIYYSPLTGEWKHLTQDSGPSRLSSNVIQNIIQDSRGDIWMATDHGGIDVLHKRDFSIKTITHVEDDRKSLPDNSISTVYQDYSGTIWIGTYKSAISYYHQERFQFPQFRRQPGNNASLPFDDVAGFAEDKKGNIWIGTNGGGMIYFDRTNGTFHQFRHEPERPNSLTNNVIVSVKMDKSEKLWIGTYFGGLDCFAGNKFIHYRHDPKNPSSLGDDRVMCVYDDSGNDLWIGTLGAGMDRLDKNSGTFYHYNISIPGSIKNNYVSSITEDSRHQLWIGTGYGIDVLDKGSGRFTHYSSDSNGLSSDNVNCLLCDSHGYMWIGTREGLNVFDPARHRFQTFTSDNGLPDNTIQCILEDKQHDIWVSTLNGVSRLSGDWSAPPGNLHPVFNNFYEPDGLQGREFNEKSGLLCDDGNMLLGGHNGLNLFDPSRIVHRKAIPPIVLTDLQLFNKIVRPGEPVNGHMVLDKALSSTSEITLRHNDNVFSLEFASLDFFQHTKDKYAYKLEGFDKSWLVTDGKVRKATYTNLDAGNYTFRVRAADEDGDWNSNEATLKIHVLPPFWKTPLAYVLYIVAILVLLYFARKMVLRRAHMRFSLEQERENARNMHEIDRMKIRFLTNMSHELRTPLSLILAPVEKLLEQPGKQAQVPQYEMIRRNARRLLHLVNQLLDFRKMEANELKLNARPGNILQFVRDVSMSFVDLADKKHIAFNYIASATTPLYTSFDHDKLERILFNLLSNAFKFTPVNGKVWVEVSVSTPVDNGISSPTENAELYIKVCDTGIGIAANQQERIFDRFFQTKIPDSFLNQGSGIGLAITLEFIKMHRGRVTVESELNKGSCFTVMIPCKRVTIDESLATLTEDGALVASGNGFPVSTGNSVPLISVNGEPYLSVNGDPSSSGTGNPSLPGNGNPSSSGDGIPPSTGIGIPPSAGNSNLPATGNGDTSSPGNGPAAHSANGYSHIRDGFGSPTPYPDDSDEFGLEHVTTPTSTRDGLAEGKKYSSHKKKSILIVEDNEDFRFYLKDNLRSSYTIHEASDGREGWKKALSLHPDLIVSDISMPVMNGIDLCRKIRTDPRTQQIPVILLTAVSEEYTQLKSLETGASDFIAKPFNFEVLQSRVRNLLEYNETIRNVYQRQVDAGPTHIEIRSADDEFLQSVLRELEKNITNPDLSVEEMSQLLNTSRSTFYKRLLLITGRTPVEFIRYFRLKRAAELLEKSQMNISEIAYTVGFNNPKYFAQQFKQEFNVAPSAYRAQKNKG